jgi:diguanylate cyclase (GGDEF)-like protein/PAS domain S-box-containing protein
MTESAWLRPTKPLLLLVDDLAANLRVLVAGLRGEYRLKTAASGDLALALLGDGQPLPDLVVLDAKMPGMGGVELLRRMRQEAATRDIPVILLSAEAAEQSELLALNLGANDYLVKPVSAEILAVRVRNLICRAIDQRQLLLAAHVFQHIGEAILITDRHNRIVAVNKAFNAMTGYASEEVIGRDPRILASGRTGAEEYQVMWELIRNTGHWQGEMWDRRKDGSIYPKMMTVSVLRDRHGEIEYHLASFIDVSLYKQSQQQLQHIAHHDALTDLPNRLHLHLHLEQCLVHAQAAGEEVVVMFMDLDRFKNINDTLGHAIGDSLLVDTGRRLKASVREHDLVARLGGDEFVLVLRGANAENVAAAVAAKVRRMMRLPFQVGGRSLHVTASIGVASFPDNGSDIGELLKCADTAMYAAKTEGGNGFRFFADEMNAHAHSRLEMENQLHEALERGEFELHFQPQLSLPERQLCGAEVLLRWRHPTQGYIAPGQFIPLAEETNQIEAIGAWVLEQTCRQGSQWVREGLAVPRLAVNVSARQMQRIDFYESVKRVLDDTGFAADGLEVEVTESTLARSSERVAGQLGALRALGVQIAIDDFGTGYSSLAQLKDLPLDRLKIDAAFVRDVGRGEKAGGGAIAAATIAMAHSLGFDVIAEGVEVKSELDFLLRQGCDAVQGYYFARPMPAREFAMYLRTAQAGMGVAAGAHEVA